MKNIVILISGGGSNMRAIVQAAKKERWRERFGAQVAAVISNRPNCAGLAFAQSEGISTAVVDHKAYAKDGRLYVEGADPRATFDAALAAAVLAQRPALLVLAGFMRILGADFVRQFEGRMLNIHPSLLPAFPGLHTHQRALDAGCRFAGATVHQVVPELDAGPILDQAAVPVMVDDTETELAARVLTQEHLLYPKAIERFLSGLV